VSSTNQAPKKSQKQSGPLVTKDQLEDACIELLLKNCQIVHTHTKTETYDYLVRLTTRLAIQPYKTVEPFAGFCSETSKKSSKNLTETWATQLEQIYSVSHRCAQAVVGVYPTIRSLVNAYNADALELQQKKELLQDIVVEGKGQRRLGPVLSERIFCVFTSTDGKKIF